jgi:hypothetical protein
MAQKPFRKTLVTPAGIAEYPWLQTPDTRFGEPTYKVNVRISGDEAVAFMEKIEAVKAEALAHLQEDPKNKKITDLTVPIVEAEDEDGNVIPDTWIVKCKAKAFFTSQDGKVIENKLTIVDAKKNPIDVSIYGGSTLKVAISVGAAATSIYKGLVFRIAGVQVLNLVTGGGASNLFSEEDGFEADDSHKASNVAKPASTPEVSDDDEVEF